MPALAIELSDAGLVAVHETRGVLPARSPGYALVSSAGTLVGEEAERRLRHEPRSVHHRFWQGLDSEPLERPYPRDLSTADLAHAHLSDFWQRLRGEVGAVEPVALAVPGGYDRGQLGLVLAISREAEIPVQGLVDLAVAAAADALEADDERPARVLHVAMGLHRTTLTSLSCGSGRVRRERVSLVDVGWHEVRRAWSRHLAALFVKATRFDPLHRAASEEQLFDRQGGWLEEVVRRGAGEAVLEAGGRRYGIELGASDFTTPLREAYSRLVRAVGELAAGEGPLLLLDDDVARLPELAERLEARTSGRVAALAEGAAGRAALVHSEQVMHSGEALPLVRSLTIYDAEPGEGGLEEERPSSSMRPTHLMVDGVARPLGDRPFVIARRGEPGTDGVELSDLGEGEGCVVWRTDAGVTVEPRGERVWLDGRPLSSPAALRTGGRLEIGPHTIWAVSVEEPGA